MTYPAATWPVRGTAALCAAAEVSEDAAALLAESTAEPAQRVFVASLVERQLFADAVAFLAHALPRREAVWWAWVCARKASGPKPPPKIQAALDATERWIVQPTDENRRQAMLLGEAADFGTPAGAAALGAFFTSGSLAPPEAPPVPPGEFMTAKAVCGSVILAAVATEPEKAPGKFQEYVRLALEVADRTRLWPLS
jgi:hypothetical protein